MTSMQKFLDTRHGKWIGRVYMLIVLFVFNALIPIGAVMYYLRSMTPAVLYLGVLGTVVSMWILSTPTSLKDDSEE